LPTREDLENGAIFMGLSKFLRLALRKLFGESQERSDSTKTSESNPTEKFTTLSRFIFNKRHYSNNKPKPSAFIPSPRDLETSVFWIDELHEAEIWRIGDEVAGRPRNLSATARADLKAGDVVESHLTVQPDIEPHPRHAIIVGWPTEKDEQKALALELCSRAYLRVR
jgi:hypothetical protein